MKYLATISEREFNITLQNRGEVLEVNIGGETIPVELIRIGGTNSYSLLMNNQSFDVEITKNETSYLVHHRGKTHKCYVEDERLARLRSIIKQKASTHLENEIKSPMPGLVVAIEVKVGQRVKAGEGVLIVEAMKMENEIKAPNDAIIKEIKIKPKQIVEMNQTLVLLQ